MSKKINKKKKAVEKIDKTEVRLQEQKVVVSSASISSKTFIGTKQAGFSIVMCFLFAFILSMICQPILKSGTFTAKTLAYAIMQISFIGVIAFIAVKDKIDPIKELNFKRTAHWSTYLIGCFLVIALIFCCTWFSNVFELWIRNSGYVGNEMSLIPGNIWQLFLIVFVVAIIPAIFEEIIFRGFICKGLLPFGKVFAVLISALVFMLFHGGIYQTYYQFILGVLFGLAYVQTGDIKISMFMHFINNAFILVFSYFVPGSPLVSIKAWEAIVAILLVILAIALVYLFFYAIKKINKEKPLNILPEANHNKIWLIVGISILSIQWILNLLTGYGVLPLA